MKRIVFDMTGVSRWRRMTVRWQVRQMGGRIIHSPLVPTGIAYIFDPEEQEERLRQDLMKPRSLGVTEAADG